MLSDFALLPRPHDDELLYSALARGALYIGTSSPKRLAELAFQDRSMLAVPDLPTGLRRLKPLYAGRWGLTDDAVLRHTHFAFWTAFRPAPDVERLRARLLMGEVWGLHPALGMCASRVRPTMHFRVCVACAVEDMRSLGYTYWRTHHQLPGALVCIRHAASLLETDVPIRPVARNRFVPATLDTAERARALDVPQVRLPAALQLCSELAAISSGEEGLLPSPVPCRRDARALRQVLRERLGAEVLAQLFRGDSLDALAWVGRQPRAAGRRHPLQEVLMRVAATWIPPSPSAYGGKTWGVYRDHEKRGQARVLADEGKSTRQVALALGVDWKTAKRLIEPLPGLASRRVRTPTLEEDIAAWQALQAAHPSFSQKALRQREPALFARLYRRARDVLAIGAHALARKRGGRRTCDWSARDAQWAARIAECARALARVQPPARVSRHRVLAELGGRSLFAHYSHRLPWSTALLARLCESTTAFQERRVRAAFARDSALPDWTVLRQTNINPARPSSRPVIAKLTALRRASPIEGQSP
jgi:hypothetical protein